jgi:hypothetical protein
MRFFRAILRWGIYTSAFLLSHVYAATCPTLPTSAKSYLNGALNFLATGAGGSVTRFTVYECAYEFAKGIFASRFDEYYEQSPDLTVRLARESADLQRAGQEYSAQVEDQTAKRNFYQYERELRQQAISKFAALSKRPIADIVKHYSNLIALLAIHGDAKAIVEAVSSAEDTNVLDSEAKFVYLKAVASCPAWDVRSAESMDSTVLTARLKSPECSEAADDALLIVCRPGAPAPPKMGSLLRKFSLAGKPCK